MNTLLLNPDSVEQGDDLLLIVVGASLRAELCDRPLAYSLREAIVKRQDECDADGPLPVLCTDVWHLNSEALAGRPVLALGDPQLNATTAHLASRLPTAMVVEQSLRIHFDPAGAEPRACLWGANHRATSQAITLFAHRYLDSFLALAGGNGQGQ